MKKLIEKFRSMQEAVNIIDNPSHKPKKVAAELKKGLKKVGKVTTKKMEEFMPRGWDYGVYITFDVNREKGKVGGAMQINFADDEVSGNVTLDAPKGVVSVARAGNYEKVIKKLVSDTYSALGGKA
jgi:hypothetical protein